jgi:catechol 2,3-dioxygenase-like lactoylglutathione lyase family enzyme
MGLPNGVHHLALMTKDIKAQIEYFTDVLGAELKALYWMHGVQGAWHGFLQLNDHSYLAFVQTPEVAGIEPVIGVSHAANPGAPSAGGTMQHVAFNVNNMDELLAMRDRIRSRGINIYGPLDHGMCHSIYFAGLEGLNLEVSFSEVGLDERAWIDPEVVALAGISDEELQRFISPAEFVSQGGGVAQPPIDPSKPHAVFPAPVYEFLMTSPDEVVTKTLSVSEPPVRVPAQ